MLIKSLGNRTPPWRFSTDLPKALLDTVIAGIGYLLYVDSSGGDRRSIANSTTV